MSIQPDIAKHENVTTLRTDAVIAAELRAEVRPLLEQVAALQNKALASGLQLGFALGMDQFGKVRVLDIVVTKPL